MASRYTILWNVIRKSDQPVTVRCPKKVQERLIKAIQQQKSKINVNRKAMNLPSYGRLIAVRSEGTVVFSLTVNGDMF